MTPPGHALITATALILAGVIVLAVAFFAALAWAARRDKEDA